jgi:chromosome segregation ATPase
MNQPTEDRLKRLEEEQRQLKEEMRKLKEQQTEPIKITRLEIDSGSMHKKLDEVEEHTTVTKIEMQGARADIRVVKANQSDIRGYLENHSQRLESIEQKLESHTEILGQIMNFGERIESTMAIKDDIANMATKDDINQINTVLAEILNRLPPKQ